MTAARVARLELPDFGMPDVRPGLAPATYVARLERLRERVQATGYDALVIYSDREHSANLSYLTGFDPRFEEAVLVLGGRGGPALLTGPENQGAARAAAVALDVSLFPPFGLLGQDRSKTRPLDELLVV